MVLRLTLHDWRVIGHYVGRLIIVVALFMLVPLIVGIARGEWGSAVDFAIAVSLTGAVGLLMVARLPEAGDLTNLQGAAIVGLSWLAAMFFSSIPLFLSGHYLSLLDANFDAMSGIATTGLTIMQDLDHVSDSINTWRHLTMFMGGQGIAVVALSLLVRIAGAGGAFEIYSGEGREERVVPNVIRTARFIWVVSLTYLVVGGTSLAVVMMADGLEPTRAVLHSFWVFMAAWDTGGFAPNSQNLLFYHSGLVEFVTSFFMIGGCLSFGLHYHLWRGNRSELWRNVEPVTLMITLSVLTVGTVLGLALLGEYTTSGELLRKGAYHLISAHTGTGFQTIYPAQFSIEWGALALLSILLAMGIGGSASSTAGGLKVFRVAVLFRAFIVEMRRLVTGNSAVIVGSYHHFGRRYLGDAVVRNVVVVVAAFIFTYFLGAALGMAYGYPFVDAIFESTSAAANVGLSSGITSAAMPDVLKVAYIIEMWAGRLEFLGLWALAGLAWVAIKGR